MRVQVSEDTKRNGIFFLREKKEKKKVSLEDCRHTGRSARQRQALRKSGQQGRYQAVYP